MSKPRYGRAHKRERTKWIPLVARGNVKCRRASNGTCIAPDKVIRPDEPWDLGHPDETCTAPLAPEHQICNRQTVTLARLASRPVPRQSRRW